MGTLVCHFTNEDTEALIGEGFPPMIPQQESGKVGSRTRVSWLCPLPRAVMDGGRCANSPSSWSSGVSSCRHLASLTVRGSGQPWKAASGEKREGSGRTPGWEKYSRRDLV